MSAINPFEAAMQFHGLMIASKIFAMMGTKLAFAIVLGSTLYVAAREMSSESVKQALIYAGGATVLYFLLTGGNVTVGVNDIEISAKKKVKEASFFLGASTPGSGAQVGAVPHLIFKAIDELTVKISGLISNEYGAAPFLGARVATELALSKLPPEVAQNVHMFLQNCYVPALTRSMANTGAVVNSTDHLPGSPLVKKYYATNGTCASDWGTVSGQILDAYKINNWWNKAITAVATGEMSSFLKNDALVNFAIGKVLTESLQNNVTLGNMTTFGQDQTAGGVYSRGGAINALYNIAGLMGTGGTAYKTAQMSQQVQNWGPYLHGYLLFMIYSLFPIAVYLSLFPGRAKILFQYFGLVFAIKGWHIAWGLVALGGKLAQSSFPYVTTHNSVIMDVNTAVLFANSIMMIIAPIIFTTIVGVTTQLAANQFSTGRSPISTTTVVRGGGGGEGGGGRGKG